MILPAAPWQDRPGLDRLSHALGVSEGQVRYVGGAVRDTLLALPVSDLDLATTHPPETVMSRVLEAGLKAVPTGLAHGTITVILPDGPVEVTTLRRDVATDGRHAEVAFTDDWGADAARRDFTINALFADPQTRKVYDYFDGLADLDAGRVRFIGDPLVRIAEDHLRILRFFRFHARFGSGAPDPAGLDACRARANDLMALSRERVAQELLKLLAVADPAPTVEQMIAMGIFAPVLPEIGPDGLDCLRRLVTRDPTPDPLLRLAALLPPSPVQAEAVAHRLKLSNAQRKRLAAASDATPLRDVRAEAYENGMVATRDRLLLWSDQTELADSLSQLDGWVKPLFPLTGGALIAMGLPPGPLVAQTLGRIERKWIEEGFSDRSRLDAIVREAVDQALRER